GLSLLADPLPAATAADWGLIWEVVEDDRLATRAQELALRLAEGPTRAYRAMKAALRASPGQSFEAQLALEAAQQQALTQTRDYREGVLAFLEKRKPDFEGR
ncbi:MAG: enoyl-CoA hydratase-related protein, partial [Pseudomonadota bacterium]